ncbi:MAG TPA: sigma-70 family RNA polymerase sigma factor [Solirubrobacterales bacterium]|nr:sigma-70 family RNA polymerase sigma factor [Solirubrobacterales bacterium]
MSSNGGEGDEAVLPRVNEGARKRAAVETFVRHEAVLRRTASRYSLCADDADDALQRALEILLTKAPTDDPRELIRWTQTVVKHEALAVRRDRERILSGPAAVKPEPGREDWVALIPADSDGPAERAERHEEIARSREALQTLKPQELRALSLLAEGYSYLEIGEITGFSQTKINRCLAEGRERFRKFLSRSEVGGRCEEMGPLLSSFCDGELGSEEATALREHLRACASCRATLRAYRAAPQAAAALVPALPLARSLLERAHDALAGIAARFGGGGPVTDTALPQVAASGSGGIGAAALAKIAVICAGGAAACATTGVLPTPLEMDDRQTKAPALERRIDPAISAEWDASGAAEEEPVPPVTPEPAPDPTRDVAEPAAEPPTAEVAPAVEYTPPPEPEPLPPPAPAPAPESGSNGATTGGNPAGEFGP